MMCRYCGSWIAWGWYVIWPERVYCDECRLWRVWPVLKRALNWLFQISEGSETK